MDWFNYAALGALIICIISCVYHSVRLIRLGAPKDYSAKAGNTTKGIVYAFTGAMSPKKKETAYLHLPTYTAGLIYHAGTFLGILLFFILLFNLGLNWNLVVIFTIILLVSFVSGLGILVKRIVKKSMRSISNPDDYISNILVTVFQIFTAYTMLTGGMRQLYFVFMIALLLYIPLGKLRHVIYFFAARYQLGYFFGWRGTWPPSKTYK